MKFPIGKLVKKLLKMPVLLLLRALEKHVDEKWQKGGPPPAGRGE